MKLRHPLHPSEHATAERLMRGEAKIEAEEPEPEDVFEGDLATHPYFQVREIPLGYHWSRAMSASNGHDAGGANTQRFCGVHCCTARTTFARDDHW